MSPEGEPHIRTCCECRNLLERRDQQIEQRNYKPPIVILYQKMKQYLDEAEGQLPKFMEMLESLMAGETTYSLNEAQLLRMKVAKLYEQIDGLSKRIVTMGSDSAEPPSPKQLQLQKNIRLQASNFLQENMLGLQSLPGESELEQLRENKRIEVQRRIEEERRAAAEREQRRKEENRKRDEQKRAEMEKEKVRLEKLSLDLKLKPDATDAAVIDSGWKPVEQNSNKTDADDPMLQQINIIRGYVKQAKQAQKFDEVKMLEDNLRELQHEWWKQQNEARKFSS